MAKFQTVKYFKLTIESDNAADLEDDVVQELITELQELASDAYSDVSMPESETDIKLDEIHGPEYDVPDKESPE